jgi:hypothetical protein
LKHYKFYKYLEELLYCLLVPVNDAMPSHVVDDLKLKAGDFMLLDVKDSTIVIRKQGHEPLSTHDVLFP